MRRRYTRKQRTALVDLVAGGRATVAEAAARLGVRPATAYSWTRAAAAAAPGRGARRARSMTARALPEPTFVRVVPTGQAAATIAVRVGAAEIQVGRDFDGELLRAVVEALRGGVA